MKIIAIIPAFNEEQTISEVIARVRKFVDKVIVINDGSTDKTEQFALRAGAKVINNIVRKGLGRTIRAGYQTALDENAEIVVQIDADNQYAAEDIPKLVKPIIENKADMVLASRFLGGIEDMPFSKKLGNKISTIVTRLVCGAKISDSTTGFRAIRRQVLEEISPTSDFTYTQEMIIRVQKEGWRIAEIASFFKKRKSGDSRLFSSVISYARNAFLIIVLTYRDYHPLKLFGIPGIILGLIGLILGLHLIQLQSLGINLSSRIGLIVLSVFLMLAGLILVFMGVLADMVEQKYRQTKRELMSLRKKFK